MSHLGHMGRGFGRISEGVGGCFQVTPDFEVGDGAKVSF
jgi:hypothetical protein